MKTVLALALSLGVLGLFIASFWYAASRLHLLFGLGPSQAWPLRIGISLVVVGAAVGMVGTAGSSRPLISVLAILGGYVLVFYTFLLLSLLCLHAIQLRWNPSMTWSGAMVLVLAFVATGIGALEANRFHIRETEIQLPGLQRDVLAIQVSDVHLGHHRGRAYLTRIVEETNRRNPDFVLITGDLVDAEPALVPGVLAPLSDLVAPAYFVGGNHEKYVDSQRAFELITQRGVRVLHNEVIETHGLQLVGLDYMNADDDTFNMHPSDDKRTIKSVLPGLPLKSDLPSVLIHHSPVGARYVAAKGIDLMISGHTHGGQIFPFTLLAELLFPFNSGLHHEGETTVFVSLGAGTFMSRVRLGTSNEINVLRLMPGK